MNRNFVSFNGAGSKIFELNFNGMNHSLLIIIFSRYNIHITQNYTYRMKSQLQTKHTNTLHTKILKNENKKKSTFFLKIFNSMVNVISTLLLPSKCKKKPFSLAQNKLRFLQNLNVISLLFWIS